MHELADLAGQVDVAIAINSLVMPDVRLIDRTLQAIRSSLRPEGMFRGNRAVDRRDPVPDACCCSIRRSSMGST